MNKEKHVHKANLATVLYAVFTGFDEMSEKVEAVRVNELVNKCYELTESVISLYGGTIDRFTGSEAMALFGIPDPLDKAPSKAVGAAVELQDKIAELIQDIELPVPIGIKIGIKTGPVLIEKIGKDKKARSTVMGDTVTVASRICDIAEKGQVLIGQETYESTKDRFEFQVMEPVPVKGKKKPLAVFELKGRKRAPVSSSIKSGRMINSDMVGREKEFRQLEKQIMQLINGRGSVVNIVGIAGIGKSRLMVELKEKELLKKVTLLEGRAISNGKNLSFHPIIQIIKSWAGIREEDSPDDSLNKLQRGIRRVYAEAFDEIFPFIATMMGYRLKGKAKERTKGIEGEALENLILKNLRDLISRAASIRPLVIVIEDAHWADISSIIFLESLFKLTRKQRILFVNVFRPGHKETGERIRKYLAENLEEHFFEINIEPLLQKQSEELINNLLHQTNLPEEINSLIIERAVGNPFFIEEVIRSLIDEGLIEIKDNKFSLTENIKYANIPESIDNVLLSRIDRLDDKTKNLLRTASVIGRNFYYKVLEEAAQTIEEMDNKLEYLKDVQLINEHKPKDEVEFLFKHALAQQATYESIVEKTKKELHFKIAGSIEKVFAGRIHEFYGMLAHHYSKAGKQEKTEEYLIKAGDESMKSGASSEAVNFLKQALETHLQNNRNMPDRQKVVDLQEKLAFSVFATGQYKEACEHFDKVYAFYRKPIPQAGLRKILDTTYNFLLLLKILYFYNGRSKHEAGDIEIKLMKVIFNKGRAMTSFDPVRIFESFYATRLISKYRFPGNEVQMFATVSAIFFWSGKLIKLGYKILDFGEKQIKDQDKTGWLYINYLHPHYSHVAGRVTEYKDEEKVYKQAIQIGEYWPATMYYMFAGLNTIEAGNEKLVLFYLKRLRSLSEVFDDDFPEVQYHRVKSALYIKFRKMEEVLKVTDDAINIAKKSDHVMQLLMIYSFRSMAFSIRQEYTEAKNYLYEAEKLLKGFSIRSGVVKCLIAKCYIEIAELKKQAVDKRDGKILLEATKELIKNSKKYICNLTESYRLRAIIYRLLNKPDKALRNFDKSIKAALSYGGNLELSRTYFETGKFLRDPKNKKVRLNGMNGTEYLLKAKSMFEEMNLQWDLSEYETYMGI